MEGRNGAGTRQACPPDWWLAKPVCSNANAMAQLPHADADARTCARAISPDPCSGVVGFDPITV